MGSPVLLPQVIQQYPKLHSLLKMVPGAGFEPAVFAARVRDFKSLAFRQFRHPGIKLLNYYVILYDN